MSDQDQVPPTAARRLGCGCLGALVFVIAILAILSWIGSRQQEATSQKAAPTRGRTAAVLVDKPAPPAQYDRGNEIAEMERDPEERAGLRAVARYRKNPPSNDAPILGDCAKAQLTDDPGHFCDVNQVFLVTRDWAGALKGRLDPARNVAQCFTDGCEGAVEAEPIRGCAWRLAIVASGSADLISSDATRMQMACSDLLPGDQLLAKTQAAKLSLTLPPFHDAD